MTVSPRKLSRRRVAGHGTEIGWRSRRSQFNGPERRAESRKVAQSRLAALTAAAKTAIDEKLLMTETALLAGGLESADARAFLEAMPSAEQLMPAIGLDDLGVKTWQPPRGAAAALLTPSTPADRRRKAIRPALEMFPTPPTAGLPSLPASTTRPSQLTAATPGNSPRELPARKRLRGGLPHGRERREPTVGTGASQQSRDS